MSSLKMLSKVQHLIVYDDDSVLPPNSSWKDTKLKERVVKIVLQSSLGGRAILERQDSREQFFQFWDGEKIYGQDFPMVKETIGKVINDNGDCVIVEYCCKTHAFKTLISNIYHVGMNNSPINFEMMGITGFPQIKEEK